MTDTQSTQEEKLAIPQREVRVVVDDGPLAYLMDSARYEQLWRWAGAFAASNTIPKHLREDKNGAFEPGTVRANCFLIINQAVRWGFDPIGLARESYVVSGVLGYQGKLVAALINSRAGLKRNLEYKFNDKTGPEREVTVIGTFKGEDEPRTITLTVAQAKTANDIWVKDPEQKLCYSGAIKWARRHCPEIVLGVLNEDDVDKIAQAEPTNTKPARARVVAKPPDFSRELEDVAKAEPEGTLDAKTLLAHFDHEAAKAKAADDARKLAELADEQIIQEYKNSLPEGHPDK